MGWVLSPLVGEALGSAVVAAEAVDAGFHQNEPVLGIHVLATLLHVAADVHGLLDQAVDVLGDFGWAT